MTLLITWFRLEFLPANSHVPFQAINVELAGLTWNFEHSVDKVSVANACLYDIICKTPRNSIEVIFRDIFDESLVMSHII